MTSPICNRLPPFPEEFDRSDSDYWENRAVVESVALIDGFPRESLQLNHAVVVVTLKTRNGIQLVDRGEATLPLPVSCPMMKVVSRD